MTTNAVVYLPDQSGQEIPHLELSAEELIFSLAPDPASDVNVHFHMKPGQPHEIKAFFDDLLPRRKDVDHSRDQEVEVGDTTGCHAFINKNFIWLGNIQDEAGNDPSLDEQVTWLNSNPDLKTLVFREGYDGVKPDLDDDNQPKPTRLTIGVATENIVRTRMRLYCPERSVEQSIKIAHHFRPITEEDRIKYRRVMRIVEKRNRQFIRINCDELEAVYGKTVRSLSGVLLGGVSCSESNKSDWLPKLLFTHKVLATNRLFSQVQAKNG